MGDSEELNGLGDQPELAIPEEQPGKMKRNSKSYKTMYETLQKVHVKVFRFAVAGWFLFLITLVALIKKFMV